VSLSSSMVSSLLALSSVSMISISSEINKIPFLS
jgi:hypothetical protein